MGNAAFIPKRSSPNVILRDGSIREYEKNLTVAELMLEHPQQVVVEFHPAAKRAAPLPADNKLEKNKVYLMLPVKRGKPAPLSSTEAHRLLMTANSILKSNHSFLVSYTGFLPLFSRMCSVGGQLMDLPVVKREKRMHEQKSDANFEDMMSSELEGRPEFLSRQLSGKKWKPSLDTIKEKGTAVKTKLRMQQILYPSYSCDTYL